MALIQSALDQIGWLLIGTDANNFIMPSNNQRIMPNIVVHERHHDEVIMTEQPVEIGAAITDHSFRNPSRLRLVYGYSNSCLKAIFKDFEDGYGLLQHGLVNFGEGYIRSTYTHLFNVLQSRCICKVVTTKRVYQNMLITSLETETTPETAFSMFIAIEMKELLRASARDYASVGVNKGGTKQLQSIQTQPNLGVS